MGLRDNMRIIGDPDVAGTLGRYAAPQPLVGGAQQVNGDEMAHGPLRRAQALPYDATRPIVASAQKINLKNADDIMGLRNRVYCLHSDTEILTKEGWKNHSELHIGEDVWTLNMVTSLAEWQPLQAINVFDVVDIPMHHYKSQTHESFCTLDHRWFGYKRMSHGNRLVPEIRTSEQITASQFMVPICAEAADLPTEPKYTNDHVALVAWMVNEGHIEPPVERVRRPGEFRRRQGTIAQHRHINPSHWQEIYDLLTRVYGAESTPMPRSESSGWKHLSADGVGVPRWLSYPLEFALNEEIIRTIEPSIQSGVINCPTREFIYSLTREQLQLYVDTSIKGDGWINSKTGSKGYSQNRIDRLEIFELCCHLLGIATNRLKPVVGKFSTQYTVDLRERKVTVLCSKNRATEQFTGRVWCPTTPNGTWFTRYKDKTAFSHNTEWQNDSWAYCLANSAQIFTKSGWKSDTELQVGEDVWTINPATRQGEWQPVQKVNRFDVTDHLMHHFESDTHYSLSTPDHRWLGDLKKSPSWQPPEFRLSQDIDKPFTIPTAASASAMTLPTTPKYLGSYVDLIAWVCTSDSLTLKQLDARTQSLQYAMTSLFNVLPQEMRGQKPRTRVWKYVESLLSRQPEMSTAYFTDVQGDLRCPSRGFIHDLTREQLESFLKEMAGISFWQFNVPLEYTSERLDRVEIFELGCILLGYGVEGSTRIVGGKTLHTRRVGVFSTELSTKSRTIERYTGVVWCPTVENSTWFARDRGKTFFTGNTDAIGEVKYGFGLIGACMSRIKLYPALNFAEESVPLSISDYRLRLQKLEAEGEPVGTIPTQMLAPDTPLTPEVLEYAERLMRDLRSGSGGSSGMMRIFALNMCVAGECYLIQIKNRWYIKSTSELIVSQGGEIILRTQRAGSSTTTAGTVYGDVILPRNTPIYRIWREHPRYSHEPDSSMLALREVCDELITLQRMIRTIARSRMNAGLLYIPDGVTAAGNSVTADIAQAEEEWDGFSAAIYDTITAPIIDESNAATVVPAILTGPGEQGANIRHIQVNREIDQFLVERCDRALVRILQGMDLPKDIITGNAQVKYTNALITNDSLLTGHVEPLALMFCDALTSSYLRPLMKRKFPHLMDDDLDRLAVWYDPTELTLPPDSSASATTGLENNVLSADAWRQAHGFSDADAPGEQELIRNLLFKLAVLQPDQMEVLVQQAFPNAVNQARAANLANSPVPFPESAAELLYPNGQDGDGRNGAVPDEEPGAPDGKKRGANGDAPSSPYTYTNQNNQENRSTKTRDQSLDGGNGYTRGVGANSGINYGRF
jgi:hypothetical protein